MSKKDKSDNNKFGGDSGIDADYEQALSDYSEKNHSLDANPEKFPLDDPEDHGEPTTADEHNREWLDDGIHMHNKDRAKKFLNSLRGHLIISQALTYGINHLRALEDREDKYPKNGEHAEPSNRSDMEYLKEHLFPLYDVFNAA